LCHAKLGFTLANKDLGWDVQIKRTYTRILATLITFR
jgi:hypothetical protein